MNPKKELLWGLWVSIRIYLFVKLTGVCRVLGQMLQRDLLLGHLGHLGVLGSYVGRSFRV